MATLLDDSERVRQQANIQAAYVDFFNDGDREKYYVKKIEEMIDKKHSRLIVNVNDLRREKPGRCMALLQNGFEEMPLIQKALREVIAMIDENYLKSVDEFFVGFEGSFGSRHMTPRILTSRFLGNTVCVEGIVTKCSTIKPKIVRSVHFCPATKKTMERRYADMSSFDIMPTSTAYPTKDDAGNLLETEFGLSKYRDHQTLTIQEMPEKAPTGQLPRSIDIVLDDDLVDICKPGDRVHVVGVYRILPGKQGGFTSGIFRSIILANSITLMSKDANLTITKDDVNACKRFSRTMNPFETMAKSLAPSICGHEFIKKAILCLLLGGVEKILANGTRLRGDINVLLIGDPSVAKSQMLRYVQNVAPRVVMTTGRGSSGVGLTAAVTTDMESGDRRLEAGAMVLADRGIVCIDEFDKMSDADRTAIHEVMEQGRVTIAKAGIHARLNARTAVLAAANPVYGRYDEYKSPMDNIGLQDSLLSRFDLLFIVLDHSEPELDRNIADHVLRVHRYRNPNEQDGEATPLFQHMMCLSTRDLDEDQRNEKTEVYEKHNPLLYGRGGRTRGDKILSIDFMKKYIHIAKCIKPVLSTEASRVIAEEYAKLRNSNKDDSHMARTQPITARSLETMIRLSTAHAKARMSKVVSKDDAMAAIELVHFAYFKRVLEKEKKKRRRRASGEDGEEGSHSEGEESENEDIENQSPEDEVEGGSQRKSKRLRNEKDPYDADSIDVQEDTEELAALRKKKDVEKESPPELMDTEEPVAEMREISADRFGPFKQKLLALFSMEREESLLETTVVDWLSNEQNGFSQAEVNGGLDQMVNDGKIMVSDGFVYLI